MAAHESYQEDSSSFFCVDETETETALEINHGSEQGARKGWLSRNLFLSSPEDRGGNRHEASFRNICLRKGDGGEESKKGYLEESSRRGW